MSSGTDDYPPAPSLSAKRQYVPDPYEDLLHKTREAYDDMKDSLGNKIKDLDRSIKKLEIEREAYQASLVKLITTMSPIFDAK